MLSVEELRSQIDDYDSRIAELLAKRLLAVREIGLVKKTANLPLVSIDREIEVLERVRRVVGEVTEEEQFFEAVEKIYFSIITVSRRMQ